MRGLCLLLPLILAAAPAGAQGVPAAPGAAPPAPTQVSPALQSPQQRLDKLFADLKRENNEKAAERIAGRIWQEWSQSGSATVDLLAQWSSEAVKAKKYAVALDFLDQVTTLQPGYAEGWNRRATVHFLMGDHARAMADIQKTLQLEPRHFGALSGMAQILELRGSREKALEAYERVLSVYPMMRSAQARVGQLTEELAGQSI